MSSTTQREKTEKTASVPNYYSLFVGGRDTDYTTEGVTEALRVVVLRVQARWGEVQAPTIGGIVALSLPVVTVVASVVQIAITVSIVSSAEEGERSCLYTGIIPTHIIRIHKILIAPLPAIPS